MKIILDTDLGDDIDDSFALACLLREHRPELAMVVTASGNTKKRARLVRDFLARCGAEDVPVYAGVEIEGYRDPYTYRFLEHPEEADGETDGADRAAEYILQSDEDVVVVAIGPYPNLAYIAKKYPEAAKKTRVFTMGGSLFRGYDGGPVPSREWNVVADADASRTFFSAWKSITLFPVDACVDAVLAGERYRRLASCGDRIARELMGDFLKWKTVTHFIKEGETSILYDTLPILSLKDESTMVFEEHGIRVTDDGYTVPVKDAPPVRCAVGWRDLDRYLDTLTDVLCGEA